MIFFGTGIVWDSTKNKVLCKFVDGKCDARELYIINKLRSLGYKSEAKVEDKETKEIKEEPKKKATRKRSTKKK